MYLRTLGRLALVGSDLRRPKPLLLLAYLAMEGRQNRRQLAELFWPDAADRMKSLGVALSRIRRAAPGAVGADHSSAWTELECDARDLQTALEQGHRATAERYEHPFLEGLYIAGWSKELEEWVLEKRESLADSVRRALVEEAEKSAAAGEFDRGAKLARGAFSAPGAPPPDPDDLQRIQRLLTAGRQSLPRAISADLAEFEIVAPASAEAARSSLQKSARRLPPTNLLAAPELIGREESLAAAGEWLDDRRTRLLTLVGPAGVGKTQLGLGLAHRLLRSGAYADGVHFVALAPVADTRLVASTIAQALGVAESGQRPALESLEAALADKSMALILDNFEQLVDSAPAISRLLAACPGLAIVVTSRVPLRLSRERAFPVPALKLPSEPGNLGVEEALEIPSIALFTRRAQAVEPNFSLSEENVTVVARICVELEGLPLALELAAARVGMLPPEAILGRLEQRLELLKGGMRDSPRRHRTLREAVSWSYDLLEPEEQRLFRRLGVFVGGFTLEGADAVGEAAGALEVVPFDGVAALIEKSLVIPVHAGGDDSPRFAMLETLREFALERLSAEGEEWPSRNAHARHYLELAEQAAAELTGPSQSAWFTRLEREHDNLRAALSWARERGETGLAYRLGASLWRFWIVRGHMREGRELLSKIVSPAADRGEEDKVLERARAEALHGFATLMHEIGDWQGARAVLARSIAVWQAVGDKAGEAAALNSLGWVSCMLGEFDLARQQSIEARRLHDELGQLRGVALALNNLGWIAVSQGEFESALGLYGESLERRRQVGDRRGVAFTRTNLGWVLRHMGCYDEAESQLRSALETLEELGDEQLRAWALLHLGEALRGRGQVEEATEPLIRSVELWRAVDNETGLSLALAGLADLLRGQGETERARECLSEALERSTRTGQRYVQSVAACRLALLALDRGELGTAEAQLRVGFALRWQLPDRAGLAECLEVLGALALERRELGHSAASFAAAGELRRRVGAPRPILGEREYESLLARLREALGSDFESHWMFGASSPLERLVGDWLEAEPAP